jgi:hypothetical protein
MGTKVRMPTGFGRAGKALWSGVASKYELRVDEHRILEDACRLSDVISALEAGMQGQELLVKGSMGQPVLNPLLAEQKTHRTALAGLLRQLKLPDEADSGAGEANQQRTAANVRWMAAHGKSA